VSSGRLRLDVIATRSSRAEVSVRRAGDLIASSRSSVRAGRRQLGVSGRFRPGVHDIGVGLRSPNGGAAHDAIRLYLGERLRAADVRRFAKQRLDEDSAIGGCVRMTARRVDCWFRPSNAPDLCSFAEAFTLDRSGRVWDRSYRCPNEQRPVRKPRWTYERSRVSL
jgi:hypothetical protein